ncbi:exodeoxyribonuclease V subunit beta [Marinobacter changyiensis]|uniref:exodeoxyribonuclease V subunit beta n=1 Tax=Marinobacter changyiensis TaxID=2604091 RepID=UPI00126497B3|nr:exodeoxyribonuclease V subunit beta [Marinobacter changyiensis]
MASNQSLDPLTFPLQGSRLIEASAGTGKTFTIALLYVRLVLGHGDIAQTGRRLTPRDILVVTFTEAATKELRDRIRKRLTEAAAAFRVGPEAIGSDADGQDPLLQLRGEYSPEQWPAQARLLQLAAESMDEAAVHTIHGWCNRMLKEHAFDSGGLFNQNLETDQSELLGQVVRDYWRTFVTPLHEDTVEAYLSAVKSPDDLQGKLKSLLKLQANLTGGEEAPDALLNKLVAERRRVFDRIHPGLPSQAADFLDLCQQAQAKKAFDGRKLRLPTLQGWLDTLLAWTETDSMDPPPLTDAAWNRLSAAGIGEAWKAEPAPTDHPLIAAVTELNNQRLVPVPEQALLVHGTHWVARRMEQEKQRRAELGFDDLLTRLDTALQGEGGEHLADTIRQQFPMAMIDEFQDTDPVQYRIFDSIYKVKENRPDTGFFMIGDPKQAIYAFRGADIYTYLQARQATAGRHVTLPRNFRSSHAMVQAANQVFSHGDTTRPEGAFLFRSPEQAGTDAENPLPFVAVDAKGRKETLVLPDSGDGFELPAMSFWTYGNKAKKDDVNSAVAEACASEIVRLLNLGIQSKAGFRDEAGNFQPLQSSDIAVLVNKGAEAQAVRAALSTRGVKSVYLSDRGSVLQTLQATDLLHWLSACAEPERDRLVRTALATSTLSLSWQRLDHLRSNELAWEDEIERFRGLRQIWQAQGVLAMIRRILTDLDVPARLLHQGGGERELTDVLHIAELLQQESQQVDGEQALIRRLAEMIADASKETDAMQVRLESDADLVQVVTVHKSKGLEYPLVFLPFATSCRPANKKDKTVSWHDERGHLQVTFDPDEDTLARADRERLGEDIRKLYVALTRARYATWVGACDIGGDEQRSALGYLAGLDGQSSVAEGLQKMVAGSSVMTVTELPVATSERYTPPPVAHLGEARLPERRAREDWWIASYSAIRYNISLPLSSMPPGNLEAETPAAERRYEEGEADRTQDQPVLKRPAETERRIHGFYRGAGPGTFLHGILEWRNRAGFGLSPEHQQDFLGILEKRCAAWGWEAWARPLANWTEDFVQRELPLPVQPDGCQPRVALAALTQAIPELEFWFASSGVTTRALDALVTRHTLREFDALEDTSRPAADDMTINGMLKGFIDLVFEHEGRYYVADYKSNYIGPTDEDYTPAAMARVVSEKRYDLQYALYLLALHRLLKSRLPDYDYDHHVGGAVYLFLRGNGSESAGVHLDRPGRELIEALDQLFRNAVLTEPEMVV